MKNIFLTGSEGFIGSHLTEKLVKSGHKVRCLVQYNFSNQSGWLDTIDNQIRKEIEIIPGDIRDSGFIEKVIGKKTEVIMNLAALIGIPYSYSAPKSYIDTNVYGLLNVLNESGFELREPGCSACLAMNDDKIPPGKYAVSTSNRNFEGRQGPGSRTLLGSPIVAAAAAVTGVVTDPRIFL